MKIKDYIFFLIPLLCSCTVLHEPDKETEMQPSVFPDYSEVTFPVNIAPPNFLIEEKGDAFQIEIGKKNEDKAAIIIQTDEPEVIIPENEWRSLLEKSVKDKVFFRISILKNNKWIRYADIEDSISAEPIDEFLTYRLLYPGYELWNDMGIYQRNITNYDQTAIAENKDFGKQCINCHTFNNYSSDEMLVHVRGKQGGTLISRNGKIEKIDSKPEGAKNGATYPAWHPSGKFIAFSTNEIQQFFHSSGKKPIEVSDLESDLIIYDIEKETSFSDSLIYSNKYMETFPNWSADGKQLYFCRAKAWVKGTPLDSIRYELYKIDFDEKTKKLSNIECIYAASKINKSVSFPRISKDGRFLMFTLSDYGNFSIWHPESDLCIIDLTNKKARILDEVNSNDVESFHSWSSSGKWFVFSSKRIDGLWAHPYFSLFNSKTGKCTKPFILPQKDPYFFKNFTYTFNLPTLIKKPVTNGKKLIETIKKEKEKKKNINSLPH